MHTRWSSVLSAAIWLAPASILCAATQVAPTNVDSEDVQVKRVDIDAAALSLSSSAFAVIAPTPVTLTATVSSATLSGSIVFMDGGAPIGSVAIKSSKAALTTSLGAGIHRLSAGYTGTGVQITSAVVNVVVDNSLVCN